MNIFLKDFLTFKLNITSRRGNDIRMMSLLDVLCKRMF